MTTHPTTPKQARRACEQLLKADRADKTEKSILPSEVRVIDRLLERGLELEDAFAEIHGKLVETQRNYTSAEEEQKAASNAINAALNG